MVNGGKFPFIKVSEIKARETNQYPNQRFQLKYFV